MKSFFNKLTGTSTPAQNQQKPGVADPKKPAPQVGATKPSAPATSSPAPAPTAAAKPASTAAAPQDAKVKQLTTQSSNSSVKGTTSANTGLLTFFLPPPFFVFLYRLCLALSNARLALRLCEEARPQRGCSGQSLVARLAARRRVIEGRAWGEHRAWSGIQY
jgi:hypothetical protein